MFFFKKKWRQVFLLLPLLAICIFIETLSPHAKDNFNLDLSKKKELVRIKAEALEIQDSQGIITASGNASLVQGENSVYGDTITFFYKKEGNSSIRLGYEKKIHNFSLLDVDKMEIKGKACIRFGQLRAHAEFGVLDNKTNTLILSGKKVFLSDGKNAAIGCKMTFFIETGEIFLESCSFADRTRRVYLTLGLEEKNIP